ncbi:MAG: ClpXP protease specificity-enhancing factor SspB [Rhodospirillaceae bacterium]|nr:ClpXP protease specificity-enhancing factor SspB [Rhodospirillaceae bacterium]
MATDELRYDRMVEKALRGVLREALSLSINGLPGDHHFYITFRTDHPGVTLSAPMRARYPEEMTIVLQHQFWDLDVTQDWFEVTLSFNHVSEKLHIPFAAVTAFADPSAKFGLQFQVDSDTPPVPQDAPASEEAKGTEGEPAAATDNPNGAEVITLDAFRKK